MPPLLDPRRHSREIHFERYRKSTAFPQIERHSRQTKLKRYGLGDLESERFDRINFRGMIS